MPPADTSPLGRQRAVLQRYRYGALVMTATALGLGALLLPRGDELLLIKVKNRDIDGARQLLSTLTRGRASTAASIVARNELFLMEGHFDEALAELETYAEARPGDVDAWTRLARLYADAQRPADETRAWAHLHELAPSADLARRLITRYRRLGDERGEADLLYALVTSGDANADEHLQAARLAAALDRPAKAIECFERLRRREPGRIDYPALELYVSLLVEREGPSRLAARIEPLPIVQTQPDARIALANALSSWDRADAAVALFESPDGGEVPPVRLALRARVALGTSQAESTARALKTLDAARPLAPEPVAALVELLLTLNDYEGVTSVLERPGRTADPRLVGLSVGHALARGDRALAQAFVTRFGDAGLSDSPLLALDLAVERGDSDAARRWIEIVDQAGPGAAESAAVAQYEVRLGLHEHAFTRLTRLVRGGSVPVWGLTDFAQLALSLDRADEALRLLDVSAAPQAPAAWARLAASAGRTDLLDRWMAAASSRAADPETLRDVYFRLANNADTTRAAAVASRLFEREEREENALLLGQALMAAGRPYEALEPLRRSGASVEAQRTYDAALLAALNAGADVGDEARRVLGRQLHDTTLGSQQRALVVEGLWAAGERASAYDAVLLLAAEDVTRWLLPLVESAKASGDHDRAIGLIVSRLAGLDPEHDAAVARRPASATRADLVRALIELDAPDEQLLPELRRLAYEGDDSWVYAYDERLAARSLTAERVTLWTSVANRPGAPVDYRRGAAARLAELGAVAEAAGVLETLAATAAPDDPDVIQLVSLWGATPGPELISWLESRLRSAAPADQPGWMDHLVRAGAARSVVSAIPRLPDAASSTFVASWIAAHESAGQPLTLRAALQQVLLQASPSTSDLRAVGRAALAHELPDVAADAFGMLASRHATDGEALRWLGALAFYDGRLEDAQTWLTRYVDSGGTEAEAFYQLGEIAHTNRDERSARGYYTRALSELDNEPPAGTGQVLRANVLVRLGERDKAASVFDHMLATDPTLDHVRADYVVALLQWGEYGRARELLDDVTARSSIASSAVTTSGLRRIDLLRVQVLTHDGRYRDAFELLDNLGVRFPSDPDVALARARFDDERGRVNAADRGYARAGEVAPEREDIARLLATRADEQAPRAAVESEFRTISDGWDERYQRASLTRTADTGLAVIVEHLQLSARQVRLGDGSIRPLEAGLSRFDASATARVGDDTQLGASLFGTEGGLGGGVRIARDDLRGRLELIGELGRPFWEFLESAADDGRRDRIAAQRQWRFRPDTAAWAYGGWHRYRLDAGARTDSAALTLGIVRTVRQANPVITLQYGLDKEQRLDATVATTSEGEPFLPIPLQSREVHLFGAISRIVLRDGWEVEGTGGYTIDRLGGRGSFYTARLSPPRGSRVGLDLWADQRLFVIATSQRVFRAGGRLSVRF